MKEGIEKIAAGIEHVAPHVWSAAQEQVQALIFVNIMLAVVSVAMVAGGALVCRHEMKNDDTKSMGDTIGFYLALFGVVSLIWHTSLAVERSMAPRWKAVDLIAGELK